MPRLTLRTLLAYIDDTLEPDQASALGRKVAESDEARLLIERIKKVTRRRGLRTPVPDGSDDDVADPNTVAAYLSDNLDAEQLKQIESTCLDSDVHLAEVAACHQILTLLLTEPVRVPPTANQRMYGLVSPPASDLNRKPGRTIPVATVAHPSAAQHVTDDPDAALLLGLKRYSRSDSKVAWLKIVAAVAGICAFLVLAIWMAMPSKPEQPPESSTGTSYAQSTTQSNNGTSTIPVKLPTEPAKLPTDPAKPKIEGPGAVVPPPSPSKKSETTPPGPTLPDTPPVAPEPKVVPPKKEEESGLGEKKVDPPSPSRGQVGTMERPKVIVLSLAPDAGSHWERVDPENPKVLASSVLMALPGYKAEVKLNTGVMLRLWGNVPEQLAMKVMVMQSRVRFYTPASGFDADFALEAGRVYLTTSKVGGGKVRVRIATETWDIELPNDKAEVMVQTHASFIPGSPYPLNGVGGELAKKEAHMVVIRGTATLEAVTRYKKFPGIREWEGVAWDSKTNNLVPPAPVIKQEILPDPDTFIASERGVPVQRVLSDAADSMKDRDGIRQLLEARMNYEKRDEFDLARILATYAYAAIVDGTEGDENKIMVSNLYDVLIDSSRMFVRQAAVTAVSAWLARSPQNTATLVSVLKDKKLLSEEDANRIAQLLRGYSAATYGPAAWDSSRVDKLIEFLNSDLLVVREVALGNLIGYYDIPFSSSDMVPVVMNERVLTAMRSPKFTDKIAAKLNPLLNRPMQRGEFVKEISMLMDKSEMEQFLEPILSLSTISCPLTNVGNRGPDYDRFLEAWKARGEDIKAWMEAVKNSAKTGKK